MDGRFIGDAADFFLLAAAFVGEAGSIEWAVDLSESGRDWICGTDLRKLSLWGGRSGRLRLNADRQTDTLQPGHTSN